MSGPARTAEVVLEEGEMVDAAICAVKAARPTLQSTEGSAVVDRVAARVETKRTGGSL